MEGADERDIKVYKDLMGENHLWAERTRALLSEHGVMMLNLIGSPGAGKTALLEALADEFGRDLNFAVLEGDIATTNDARRMAARGIEASQLLTGGACHLEAKLVHHALLDLKMEDLDLVVVENVGNLVCPAEFDIGENHKIAVLSVTEGEDKPTKYPLLFRESSAVVVTKVDLLPYLDFDEGRLMQHLRSINAEVPIFRTETRNGEGIAQLAGWILKMKESIMQSGPGCRRSTA